MKPNDLYKRATEEATKEIGRLKGCYYDHLPEIESEIWNLNNERVVIKYYKNHCFDGRRVWQLASVWLDEYPVMIIQNAGREGDDHHDRFITDKDKFREMIYYIESLIPFELDDELNDLYNPEEDIKELATFYGNTLDGYFERY